MRAGIYARVSSLGQADRFSIPGQLALCRRFAQERGWEIGGEYIDAGASAFSDKAADRPEWTRLLDAVRAKQLDVIIVAALDRWARRLRLSLESLDTLRRNDVAFVSISENLDFSTPSASSPSVSLADWQSSTAPIKDAR